MTSKQKNETSDRLAGKIVNGILRVQLNVSARMNRLRSLKAIMIGFCILCGSLSVYHIVDAIVSPVKVRMKVDRIRAPRMIDEAGGMNYDEKIPEEVYREIQDYKKYMDSLGVVIRPGLADSMRILEELYIEQHKTSEYE